MELPRLLCFVAATVFGAFASLAVAAEPLPSKDVDQIALYAMMASNAYARDPEKIYFPIERLGWRKVDERGNAVDTQRNSYSARTIVGAAFSNLQFDIWEDANSARTVFAFKGTKEKIDWAANLSLGVSIAYKSAKKHVRAYILAHPERVVSLSGHSLGGGIALSVSFWEGLDVIAFNTSPRVFDGLRGNDKAATRLAVFQEHDVLQDLRRHYPVFLKKIPSDQIVETHFDYAGRNAHRIDLLAEGLLACSTGPALKELAKGIKLSVGCYVN
uniref:hypothetical protein n=1 Tax=unclassified Variovorax TaxID=663243 RepID=UPI000D3DA6F8